MLVNSKQRFDELENKIELIFKDVLNKYSLLGYLLSEVSKDNLFELSGYKSVNEYAAEKYDLASTTVSTCIGVSMRFANEGVIKDDYKDYSYSKLTEMLPLTDEQLKEITPEMTVKEIREKKKLLLNDSNHMSDDNEENEDDSNPTSEVESNAMFQKKRIECALISLCEIFKIDYIDPFVDCIVQDTIHFSNDSYIKSIVDIDSFEYEFVTSLTNACLNRCYFVKLDKFVGMLFVTDSSAILIKDTNLKNINEIYKAKFLKITNDNVTPTDFLFENVLKGFMV